MSIRQYFSITKNFRSVFIREHDRLAPLDGFRALSILTVIFYHAYYGVSTLMSSEEFTQFASSMPHYLLWVEHADKGVDVFFVLSGFLIGNMLLKELIRTNRIELMQFYIKRGMRLFPAAWVLVFLAFLGPSVADKTYLWATMFYVQNFLDTENIHVSWTWSLAVEEQFYILAPLVLLATVRNKKALSSLIVLWLLSFVIRYVILLQHPQFYHVPFANLIFTTWEGYDSTYFSVLNDNLYTRYGALTTGMIGACLYTFHRGKLETIFIERKRLATILVWGSILMAIAILNFPIGMPGQGDSSATIKLIFHTVHHNLFSLNVLIVMLACLLENRHIKLIDIVRRFLALKCWYPIAQLTYPMYLFHIPILFAVAAIYKANNPNFVDVIDTSGLVALFLFGTFAVFLFSLVIHLVLEKPVMNMRTLLGKKNQQREKSTAGELG